MKLFIKDDCDFCSQIRTNEVNIKITNVNDKSYQGAMPHSVPMLQFNNHYQLADTNVINAIFDEIRKHK
jgi:hypothetical protein|tara:strand:- start:100 stop:306 length:207 start_codon:yes stop_codon:yes gene_type:complete